jgi:predicted ATPase/class 3 adenylate cyclase
VSPLPSGEVTFCFTDIEGSTQLFARLGPSFLELLEEHRRLIRSAVAAHGGHEVKTEGDGFFLAFHDPHAGVAAAIDFQRAIASHGWPVDAPIRVRAGLHLGGAVPVENDYAAFAVHEAARIGAAAHGGQTVVSEAVLKRLGADHPADVSFKDLGLHELKDIGQVRIHQACHPALMHDFPPLRATVGPRGYIPATTSSLIGREDDISDLAELIAKARLVTITGSGGVGKTRLAIEVARRQLGRHADGVWFVDLAPVTDPAWVADTTLQALGVVRDAALAPRDQLLAYLRTRDVLLVVDNCEHVLDACIDLTDQLLTACAGVSVLATSRESLGIDGEVGWRARSLDAEASVELFRQRAMLVRPDFDGDDDAMGRIVERLDGIPLAIELAAARMRVLTAAQIADRLDDRFSLLTGGRKTALARQRTLEATVDWSYALLDDDERMLLRRLSVFVGGFDLNAVEAVWGSDAVDLLDRLADKSMVVAHLAGDTIRYRLLETIRQYSWVKLVDADEAADARTSHARYYAALLEVLTPGLRDERETSAAAALDAEQDNIRAALEWASATGDGEVALRLVACAWLSYAVFGRSREGLDWMERILPMVESGETELLAQAYAGAAHLAWITQVPRDEMATYARRVVEQARARGGDPTWYDAWAISLLAMSPDVENPPTFEEAIEWADRADDPFVAVQAYTHYANVMHSSGSHEKRDRAFDSLLGVARRGPWSAQCYALQSLARRMTEMGRHDEGVALALDSLAAARRGPNVYFVVFASNAVGFCKGLRGDSDADTFLLEGIDVARHRGLAYPEAESLADLAWIEMQNGEPGVARQRLERAADLVMPLAVGNLSMLMFGALAQLGIAETFQMEGRLDEAAPIFEANVALAEGLNFHGDPVFAILLNSLGLLRIAQGDPDSAEELFRRAVEVASGGVPGGVRTTHSRATGLRGIAHVAQARGDREEAARLCGASAGVHEIWQTPRLALIRYRALVDDLRAELGGDFDGAWKQGEQLGLDAAIKQVLATA